MVGSKHCSSSHFEGIVSDDNPCQQFIINGKQKIVVPFERMNSNEVISYEDKGVFYTVINSKSFIDRFTNINKLQLFVKEGKNKMK